MPDLNEEEKAKLADMREQSRKAKEELQKEYDEFWSKKYPKLSLGERKEIWKRNIAKSVLWQNKTGGAPFTDFTPENYQEWKTKYKDMNEIMDYIIESISDLYMDEDLKKILNKKIGRV